MTAALTAAQVKSIVKTLGASPRADLVVAIVRGWPEAVPQREPDTRSRAGYFLANIMTETGGLQILSESGTYCASRIMQIFCVGKRSAKITDAEARRIASPQVSQRGPVLFDRVYGIGNPTKAREFGHARPGQGWLYHGGGMLHTNGLSGYRRRAKETGLPLVEHPELFHQPDSAFKSAYLTWGRTIARTPRPMRATSRPAEPRLRLKRLGFLHRSSGPRRRSSEDHVDGLEHVTAVSTPVWLAVAETGFFWQNEHN
jgi:predicted chitinase